MVVVVKFQVYRSQDQTGSPEVIRTSPSSETSGMGRSDELFSLPEGVTIDRSRPVADQIYILLRRAIVSWRLRPGEAITDAMVAQRLHISRTPLREAFRRLALDGLVVIRPQAGTFVSAPDRRSWEEGRLIRRSLELEGIRLAAVRVTEDDIHELAKLLDQEARAVSRAAPVASLDIDDEFHASISKLSGFPRLWMVIDGAKAQIDRLRYAAMTNRGLTAIAEHHQILDALRARDPKRGAQLLADHLDRSDGDIAQLLDGEGWGSFQG
jgi:DNA-binding GntR family transcriptional regulator